MFAQKKLEIVHRNPNDLIAAEYNPRKISSRQIAHLKKSLKNFDCVEPIVINANPERFNIIVGGHQRLKAMIDLKYDTVPCVEVNLSLEQEKELNIRLNKNTGDFDMELLQKYFAEDSLLEFGFEQEELNFNIEENLGLCDPDEVPEVQDNTISVLGDVWLMGGHRLRCGDSTNATDVEALLKEVKPHLMVTDPPYGVEYDANWRNEAMPEKNSETRWKDNSGQALGAVLNDDRADWSEAWALAPCDVAYVWHAGNKAHIVAQSLEKTDFEIRAQIIWSKSHFAISRGHYHPMHEPCWYAVKKKATGHWKGDRKQTTIWDIPKLQKSETGHSTQKPIECMKKPIENNSSIGQVIYEPFCGSGTTLIAAEMTSRTCYAMELSPAYCDVIVRRWQKFTGKKAINEQTGKEFEENL